MHGFMAKRQNEGEVETYEQNWVREHKEGRRNPIKYGFGGLYLGFSRT